PQFLEAYDWLAKAQEELGNVEQAQQTLQAAVQRSPHAVQRLRRLARVAQEAGDVDTAHQIFQKVVNKTRFSEFREPEDHVCLVETALEQGEVQLASSLIRDLTKTLSGATRTPVCRALSMAMLHRHAGKQEQAVTALEEAVTASRETVALSADARMMLARNCLQSGLEQEAVEVMTTVVGNVPTGSAVARTLRLFQDAGRQDLIAKVKRESREQVNDLVAAGAEK